MLSVVSADGTTESLIDEIVREGARRILAAALETEVNQYIAELAAERDERGHRLVVRNGRYRPMRDPELVVGDGALGFWKALREVFPETHEQRCWVHKTANVIDSMPKSTQPAAKRALQDIYNAEDRDHAEQAIEVFAKLHQAKFPKAVAKITGDQDELLAFYDYPAEHWIHLRTTNSIESTFATVRLRTKVTKGAGSRAAGLAMVFQLVESAQARWRAVNGAHLVPPVRTGARFERGLLVERHEQAA
ncbi:transposase [Streptomyces sp. NPDC005056]